MKITCAKLAGGRGQNCDIHLTFPGPRLQRGHHAMRQVPSRDVTTRIRHDYRASLRSAIRSIDPINRGLGRFQYTARDSILGLGVGVWLARLANSNTAICKHGQYVRAGLINSSFLCPPLRPYARYGTGVYQPFQPKIAYD